MVDKVGNLHESFLVSEDKVLLKNYPSSLSV